MICSENLSISQAIKKLEQAKYKCLVLVGKKQIFSGTLTDGDIRRAILKGAKFNDKIRRYIFKGSQYLENKDATNANINKIFDNKKDGIFTIPILDEKKSVIKVLYPKKSLNYSSNKKYKNSIVIMAGGKGQRLEPFTSILPKPLAPIDGQTLLEKIMLNFKSYNFHKFFISINYKKEIIKAYFKDNKKFNINFIEEKKPTGTAGSLNLIPKKISSDFIISNCDIMVDINYHDLIDFHKKSKFDLTLVASEKNFKIPYGVCTISNMMLKKMIEKPQYNFFVNTGLYVMKKSILTLLPSKNYLDMNEFIKILIKKDKKVGIYPISGKSWIDIGQWKEYRDATDSFKKLF